MLVDEVTISIEAGKGGNGLVAFRREKYIPKGGPWGGDGGRGGDIYLEAVSDIGVLRRYKNQLSWKAEPGEAGGPNKRHGSDGKDLVLRVPVGTLVTDFETGKTIDFTYPGEKKLIAHGGKGGWGNIHFATATRQTPRIAQPGKLGEKSKLKLELRLIADVGFIGLPNAGKSSLLNELTHAAVKVGTYPFTTVEPNLGVCGQMILADIPGLIEGASSGRGLGVKFLRHIERTRILAHCISSESDDPKGDYKIVHNEMDAYNKLLTEKEELILLTKSDLISETELKKKIRTLKILKREVVPVSIHDWDAIKNLKKVLEKSIVVQR